MSEPEALLEALDEEQRVVAEALHGPVCVLAGAGTGKTRAITHRIAYGVRTGAYDPKRVMALTFTSRAANELRARLHALGAGGVPARTFHSAALAQLNHFWPQLAGGPAPRILEGKARVLAQAAQRIGLAVDTATLRDVAGEIEWRKVTGRSVEQYASAFEARGPVGRLSLEQVLELQAAYETLKDERRALDFEDVLLATAGMIAQEPAVAMHVREQYRHFVVDEYQDVSPLQQQLLELWLDDRSEVCVVGDASQTIYSFAGADAGYLLGFERRWHDATLVRLVRNYRSAPPIIGYANRIMAGRAGALQLRSGVGADAAAHPVLEAPPIHVADDDLAEARHVAARIRSLIDDGAAASGIAVLTRVNSQSAVVEQALGEAGVSHRVRGGARFFDLPEVREAVRALRAAALTISDEPLFKSVSDVLRSLGWSVEPPTGPGAVRARWESLNTIAALVDGMPAGTTFRQFADQLSARADAHHEPTVEAVTIATVHSAKGLEWDAVFLIGLAEGLLPISYARREESIDEERRLFYVGVTRARRRLELSWAKRSPQSRADREPSRFLREAGSRIPAGTPARAR
ncbi:ATP-dependent helicase [Agromyces archimandritae]|uniref:DNA 3'-5' helicase n=1 Tax=Agromyces archimandritae TaxID=2781962 RepID=A0A975IN62_9MICO|nr:ATP-dependent helicase [Agromyces archimandritae]QTX04282.1 ATP-dependent helicase [Agromyces archimandritae]